MALAIREYKSKTTKKTTFGYDVEVVIGGHRIRKIKRGFTTKTLAEKEGRRVEIELKDKKDYGDSIEDLLHKDKNKITLYNLLDLWLNSKKLTIKPTTLETYKNYCIMIKKIFNDVSIKKISSEIIQYKLNDLINTSVYNGGILNKNKKISSTTIRHYYNTLNMAFEYAVKMKYIKHNPCDKVDPPKKEIKEMQIYDENEIYLLLDNIKPYSSYIPVLLALTTGMREGEIAGLKWSSIDLDNHILTVTQQIQKVNGKLEELSLKTSNGKRNIILFDYTVEVLTALKNEYSEIMELNYVVCKPDGSPYDPDTIGSNYRRLMKTYDLCGRLGLKYIRFHDLRHSHATLLLADNVSAKIITERLGHGDVKTTLNTYTHVTEQLQRKAISTLGSNFMKIKNGGD